MRLAKVIPLVFVCLLALIGYLAQKPDAPRIALFLLDRDLTTDQWNGALSEIIPPLVRGTSFEGQWQINQRPNRTSLNIYVFAPKTAELSPVTNPLLGNCAFIGPPSIIVCDETLLRSFLEDMGALDWYKGHPQRKQFVETKQKSFLYWILGHELGHVLKGHRPAHFQQNEFEAMVKASSVDHKQEYEADAFAVEKLMSGGELRTNLESMLMDVINAEIRKKVGTDLPAGVGIIYDYNNEKVVEYFREGTHPEFVVRAARMLIISAERSGQEGFKNFVTGFVRHMRERQIDKEESWWQTVMSRVFFFRPAKDNMMSKKTADKRP